MPGDLLPVIAAIAPAASDIVRKLIAVKKNANSEDATIILLSYIIEQNERDTKALASLTRAQNRMTRSIQALRIELIRTENEH